jgi:hypothetical protein
MLAFNIGFALISTLGLFFNFKTSMPAELTFVLVSTLITGVAVYAVVNYFSNKTQSSAQGYVYGIYGTTFLVATLEVNKVFLNIIGLFPHDSQLIVGMILILTFNTFCAYAFLFGFMQLVTGGWRFMK